MIIPIINQKKLVAYNSQEDARKTVDVLKANGIELYEKTVRSGSSGTMARMYDAKVGAFARMQGYDSEPGGGYAYIIYVKRSDYERALKLI